MEDAGMSQDAVTKAIELYESDARDELVRFLRLHVECDILYV